MFLKRKYYQHLMDFRVQNRDGPARIGHLTLEKKTVVTPNILFLHTTRCRAPEFSDILLTQQKMKTSKPVVCICKIVFPKEKKGGQKSPQANDVFYPRDMPEEVHLSAHKQNKNTEYRIIPSKKELLPTVTKTQDASVFIVASATQLYSQQTQFVEFITELRQTIGYDSVVYLPCVGDPTTIALLTYMGVDLFDSFSAILAARNDTFLFPTGSYTKNQLAELPCSCPSCVQKNDGSKMDYEGILQHNYRMLSYAIKETRNAIIAGSLRELVEIRARTSPHLAALVRLLDLNHYDFLEQRTPMVRKQPLIATTKDALVRPEIRRFQDRVIHRFEKPASTQLLLVLPCSAKKPYSFSKSHKLFRECLANLNNPFIVHELILTSPLGLVPRELELTYPASSYDTAVTGYWDEDEKGLIRSLLQQYLTKNSYDTTIVHVPPSIQAFVNDLFTDPQVTCMDSPTSAESLTRLSEVLHRTTSNYARVNPQRRVRENITALACFQFGPALAAQLMNDTTITGKYPYLKIMDNKKQLGMMTEERGLISLTMDGAERFADAERYWVEISDDFPLKGSVLAPGIKDADEAIRIGDEVVVRKNNRLCGIGVALMNGDEMTRSVFGEAVKIRHHR